jgi:hypothetical protein
MEFMRDMDFVSQPLTGTSGHLACRAYTIAWEADLCNTLREAERLTQRQMLLQSVNQRTKRLLLQQVRRLTHKPLAQKSSLSCMGLPNGHVALSRKDLPVSILLRNPMARYAVRLVIP